MYNEVIIVIRPRVFQFYLYFVLHWEVYSYNTLEEQNKSSEAKSQERKDESEEIQMSSMDGLL